MCRHRIRTASAFFRSKCQTRTPRSLLCRAAGTPRCLPATKSRFSRWSMGPTRAEIPGVPSSTRAQSATSPSRRTSGSSSITVTALSRWNPRGIAGLSALWATCPHTVAPHTCHQHSARPDPSQTLSAIPCATSTSRAWTFLRRPI